jgi:hypothetical protein
MGALLDRFRADGIRFTALEDGRLHAAGKLTGKLRSAIRAQKAAIVAELTAANDGHPNALADPSVDRRRAKALALLEANPSWRRVVIVEAGPCDDRRLCTDCANLRASNHGGWRCCLAAERGELEDGVKRSYHPTTDIPRRCEAFTPRADDPDQRTGRELSPNLTAGAKPLRVEHHSAAHAERETHTLATQSTKADGNPVIIGIAVRTVGYGEIEIPAAKYDVPLLMAMLDQHGGTTQ